MKTFKFILCIHRILGTVLSVLFLMWFLSGFVMMYHTYPSLTEQQRMAHAEALSANQPEAPTANRPVAPSVMYESALPIQHPPHLSALSLQQVAGRPVVTKTDSIGERLYNAQTGSPIQRFSAADLLAIASRWQSPAAPPPVLLDTLGEIDIWLIGAMPFNEYPIYHYALNDGRGSELYLSSRTGRALQLTDSRSRFWAWLGAIPHWIYITKLRATGRQPWTDTVLWLSGLGILMTLSGIVVGLRSMFLARRWRKSTASTITPYKKTLFRWHHIFGLCFGLFVLTWIFSGFMSLADAPQLLWPVRGQHSARDIYADSLQPSTFTLPTQRLLQSDNIKKVEWIEMGHRPYYRVWTAEETYLVDASDSTARRVTLSADDCGRIVKTAIHHDTPLRTEMLTSYDNYYVSQHQKLPLPVCRVTVDDGDGSTFYINPQTADCRYYNDNRRAGKWMYSGLHALNTPFFARHPTLRQVVIWMLLLGGTAVSLTGLLLAIGYLRRKLK